jgi:hypothetical protein
MRKLPVVLAAIAVAVGVLWVLQCSGPRSEILETRLVEPGAPGAPYRIEATVHNEGPGHGQVNVILRLRHLQERWTVQEDRQVSIEAGESARVTADLFAPPGPYAPEVELEYPAR